MSMCINLRIVSFALFFFSITVFTGCIDVQQELTIDKENRGSFEILAKMPEGVVSSVGSEISRFLDPVKGAAYFDGNGITIRSYRVYKHGDSMRYIRIKGDITDMKKALESGCLGKASLAENAGGTRFEFKLAAGGLAADKAVVANAFKGLKLNLQVNLPAAVTATSGTKAGNTAVRWDMDVDSDPAFLKKSPVFYVEYK